MSSSARVVMTRLVEWLMLLTTAVMFLPLLCYLGIRLIKRLLGQAVKEEPFTFGYIGRSR